MSVRPAPGAPSKASPRVVLDGEGPARWEKPPVVLCPCRAQEPAPEGDEPRSRVRVVLRRTRQEAEGDVFEHHRGECRNCGEVYEITLIATGQRHRLRKAAQ